MKGLVSRHWLYFNGVICKANLVRCKKIFTFLLLLKLSLQEYTVFLSERSTDHESCSILVLMGIVVLIVTLVFGIKIEICIIGIDEKFWAMGYQAPGH